MRTVASLVLAVLVLAWSTPALGQGSEMAGKKYADNSSNVDQQIVNASKQLEEALKAYVTRGKSTAAGVSGAVSSLLIDSDTIICASWLMAFERTMTTLAIKGAFQSEEGAALMQAMQNLKNRVEAACQGVLNNTDPPRNAGPTGDGSTPSGTCPECDALRDAYETAQYRFDRAQFELDRARVRTDAAYDLASTHPEIYSQHFVSTPQQLEADQDAKEDALERARAIRDAAHKAYLNCLEACHKRTRTQVGFFGSNRNKTLVGVAAVAVTGLAFAGGGSGTPAAVVSTPAPAPVVSIPTTTVVSTPVPTPPPPAPPTLLSTVPGRWICILCVVGNDTDHHEDTLHNCPPWMQALFEIEAAGGLRINHPEPWVIVTGNLDESTRRYRGTGMGRIGPFSNVSSTVVGDFDGTGEAVRMNIVVTLGENGVFPGGRPVSYALTLTKTQ